MSNRNAKGNEVPDGRHSDLIDAACRQHEHAEAADPADAGETATLGEARRGGQRQVGPYRILERIGEGGMGIVYLAEQTAPIRRRVALKLIKLGMDTRQVVARFEAERQALALMNHPNVARALDAGATPEGRPYFVMEYVRGVPVTEYCDRHRVPIEERLRLFAQVCTGVQHAHQKGIIHRDIKPSNILVTIEEDRPIPKVIDFGVAKATEQRLTERTLFTEQGQLVGTPEYMSPEQAEMTALDVDTRTDIYSLGVVLYELLVGALPLEPSSLRQEGFAAIQRMIRETEPQKPSTRLGSLGAESSESAARRRIEPRALLRRLRGDLDWITMKAIDKDRTRRYASAAELAADIQRHLGHEPVLAGPPSAPYRLAKFARRNRQAVLASAVVLAALVAGLVTSIAMYARAEAQRQRADRSAEEAKTAQAVAEDERSHAVEARSRAENERLQADDARLQPESARALADARREEIGRLADLKRLADARAAAEKLWPACPEKITAMEAWLTDQAFPLRERLETQHRPTLAALRSRALPYDSEQEQHDRQTHSRAGELAEQRERLEGLREQLAKAGQNPESDGQDESEPEPKDGAAKTAGPEKAIGQTEQRIAELEQITGERRTWRFTDDQSQWQHDTLTGLVADLEKFADPDPRAGTLASVQERLDFARTIRERTVTGEEVAASWADAIADISRLEVYAGLQLMPQLGLVPLGRNPHSGLWEFWHLQTGARPERNRDPRAPGGWLIAEETGLVFVLLPGGRFLMGAQSDDPDKPNHDPQAQPNEGPVHQHTLTPFFLSKYEMTQGQWERFNGINPSQYGPGIIARKIHLCHPVEQVSWTDCQEVLERLGLILPTEAQWEYGSRGGSTTPWWTGASVKDIWGNANICDQAPKKAAIYWNCGEDFDDGYVVHAPVGSFGSNRFGLHDTIGNVWEWCRDWEVDYTRPMSPGDGERKASGARPQAIRGGSFDFAADDARSAHCDSGAREGRYNNCGLRPARVIDP